jgi:hypothetical protein
MERHRPKSKSPKNGLQRVQETVERSALQQDLNLSISDFVQAEGFDLLARGSKAQVKRLREIERLLADATIHHIRKDYRQDAISLFATVPGQRWEIDVLEDGEVEWECFKSEGELGDERSLLMAVSEFSEPR